MSLFDEWVALYEEQDNKSFKKFWDEYSTAETKIYKYLLSRPDEKFSGTVKERADELGVSHPIFAGFLDGINESLKNPMSKEELESIDEDTAFELDVDYEKLYFNMHNAKADYLYSLPEWDDILTEERRAEIAREYKMSKTVVKGVKIGRNDPCPCGSGKKYKKCCGAGKTQSV